MENIFIEVGAFDIARIGNRGNVLTLFLVKRWLQ